MIPKHLQPIFWSQKITNIDLKKDCPMIIHHVLAYGTFKDIKWLAKTYSKHKIVKNFIENPMSIYTKAGFNFIARTLLGIRCHLYSPHYVKNIYRNTGRAS